MQVHPDDRRFLLAAHLGLLPVMIAPVICCAPLAPFAGAMFLIGGNARGTVPRYVTAQLLFAQVALLIVLYGGAFVLGLTGANPRWGIGVAAIAAAVAAAWSAATVSAGRAPDWPVLGALVRRHFIDEEPADRLEPGAAYRRED